MFQKNRPRSLQLLYHRYLFVALERWCEFWNSCSFLQKCIPYSASRYYCKPQLKTKHRLLIPINHLVMKHIFKILTFSMMALVLWAYKNDENRIYCEGGTAPVLQASASGTNPLLSTKKNEEAVRLSWNNPNYSFTTGVSSQDVTYTIQIDTTGANFTN